MSDTNSASPTSGNADSNSSGEDGLLTIKDIMGFLTSSGFWVITTIISISLAAAFLSIAF